MGKKELKLEAHEKYIKKHADKNLTVHPLNSSTKKNNTYMCRVCKKTSNFNVKSLRRNLGKIKLKCAICFPATRVMDFKTYNKRVLEFNSEYIVDPESYSNTAGKVMVTHKICGEIWNPRAKDLMEGRSSCPSCGGRSNWNLNF